MTEAPLAWVKQIQSTLIETNATVLSGFVPDFPWEPFSEYIAALLQAPELKISAHETKFLKGSEITSGFGTGFVSLALEFAPLIGQAFWIMGKEDVAKLTAQALVPSNGNKGFSSSKFQEGFYYYLATLALNELNALQAFKDLAITIGKPGPLPQEESLCIDVELQHPKFTLWGRLICPAALHLAFKMHFSKQYQPLLSSTLAKQIPVTVRVQLGETTLSLSKWKQIHVGDFILLDRCTFDPKTHKGTATLMLEQTPLLRVRIKDNHLKIVDYALYREEKNSMHFDQPENEDSSEENAFSSSEFQSEEMNEPDHLWSAQNGNLESIIPTQEIPLTLTVEVARLSITLEKLLQLSPGNTLELSVRPEQGVALIINGKTVGKAELIKLGDMLGVKILQLGE